MIKYKKVRRQVEEIDKIQCNKCGNSCLINGHLYGLSVIVSGGYDSIHLNDLTDYKFELCEECLVKLFGEFTIPPDLIKHYCEKSISWKWKNE